MVAIEYESLLQLSWLLAFGKIDCSNVQIGSMMKKNKTKENVVFVKKNCHGRITHSKQQIYVKQASLCW